MLTAALRDLQWRKRRFVIAIVGTGLELEAARNTGQVILAEAAGGGMRGGRLGGRGDGAGGIGTGAA